MERDQDVRSRALLIAAFAACSAFAHAQLRPPESFVLFPAVPPNSQSSGAAVSSNGYAAGARTPSGVTRYVPGTGFQNLGRPLGHNNVGVFGVNSRGVVVGGASGSGSPIAYRYDDGAGFSVVASGRSSASAYAISDSGFITGETDSRAFLYSPSTGVVALESSTSVGYAVNERGQVTGFGSSPDQAFLYTPGVGVQYLSPPSASRSYGRGINDLGQVLVEVLNNNLSPIGAYVYTPGADYALLPNTSNVPLAMRDINNQGWVVGNLRSRGTLWVPEESIPVDLTAYIRTYFGGSYTVNDVNAVNDAGQIVGRVSNASGISSGFILTVPSPSTLGVTGIALLGLGRRRRL